MRKIEIKDKEKEDEEEDDERREIRNRQPTRWSRDLTAISINIQEIWLSGGRTICLASTMIYIYMPTL